ncbi:MAG: hypothetical protein GTO30_04335, partial [Acidobacteria bacterium]|nr:hypothetical protein [Acidobacteriota bacterium]NIQ85555.1 hypothetical protein [Acidobacteriota bacterium]
AAAASEDAPDLYYFIFDAYTSADHLAAVFDHDNGPFLDELRKRGFFVAERSRSNYTTTLPSLASTLNMEYHSEQNMWWLYHEDEAAWKTHMQNGVLNSEVLRVLKQRG